MWCFHKRAVSAIRRSRFDDWEPVYSFDHAPPHQRWHKHKEDCLPPSDWCKRMPLPTPCGDFQQVIEHTLGDWKTGVHAGVTQWLVRNGKTKIPLSEVRAISGRVAQEVCTQERIARDVGNYLDFLEIVKNDKGVHFTSRSGKHLVGTGGNWPPPAFR